MCQSCVAPILMVASVRSVALTEFVSVNVMSSCFSVV